MMYLYCTEIDYINHLTKHGLSVKDISVGSDVKLSRLTKIIESDGNDEELLLDKENYVKLVYFYVKKMEEINIWGRNLSIKKGGANAAICDSSPWKKIVYIEGAEKVILNGSVGFNNLEIDNVGLIENPINKDCKVNIDSNIEFPMKGGK